MREDSGSNGTGSTLLVRDAQFRYGCLFFLRAKSLISGETFKVGLRGMSKDASVAARIGMLEQKLAEVRSTRTAALHVL